MVKSRAVWLLGVLWGLSGCVGTAVVPGLDGGEVRSDAGERDAGGAVDAGGDDGGSFEDAGSDAGEVDAGGADAGVDAGVDAGAVDAGAVDAGGPFGLATRPPNPTCVAAARPVVPSGVKVVRAFMNLTFSYPMLLLQPPNDPSRIFVAERAGVLQAFPNSANPQQTEVQPVLDIHAKINTQGEGGFLGVAFPPDWSTNKVVYVSYTETGVSGHPLRSVISRFRSTDSGATLDPGSEEVILKLDQPYDNHDGGNINFGPDGYLYIGFGDGGSGGDPLGSGQRVNTLLGKMLRINVNVPAAQRYAIPATNPFASDGDACNLASNNESAPDAGTRCGEIYAWGLRNPWRWSFDSSSGDLWVGDVGQGAYEEVDRVELGGNYGWNTREGFHCYGGSTCATAGLIDPLVEYDHSQGQAITGGFVYRGTKIPGLIGRFVFGDYQTGRVWAMKDDLVTGAHSMELLQDTNLAISSFGQTLDGEIYALDLFGGTINQLVPSGTTPPDTFPQHLSETGCFDPTDAKKYVPAMILYDLNSPLWSDGAAKERAFAIPDSTTITVNADGDFDLPKGSVVAKTFSLNGKRVETRLLMRHSDGDWAGYTYEWNDAQTDATLLPAGQTKTVGTQQWTWPTRAQCLECHTSVVGRTIGLEAAQLNRDFRYPSTGLVRNELATLEGVGFFSAPLGSVAQLKLEPPSGTGALEARARAYLHSNCSMCHRQGAGQGPQDFRASLSFKAMNVCNVAPTAGSLGLSNPMLFAPGVPARSIISHRMQTNGAVRMPPLGTVLIDPNGSTLIDQWISSVTSCP